MITDYMGVYQTEPEYAYTHEDYVPVRVGVATMDGGTVGKVYENKYWIVNVWEGDELVFSSSDLHTQYGITHHSALIMTLDWLANPAEDHTDDRLQTFVDDQSEVFESIYWEVRTDEHKRFSNVHDCDTDCALNEANVSYTYIPADEV
ncbi:hypothetical protein AB0I72_26645 [Nocardiopsis sp. NPDC049922]|uniref:hypothetical protein n=1 Tax=Nocardiopsis sp. NPDC049922 TaxID=3155157 RepID=UPI003408AE64